jgi:hypothetical protein
MDGDFGLCCQQFGNADQVVGDQVKQKIGSDGGDAAVLGFAHRAVLFAPAEDAFDHRPALLRQAIALVPRRAPIDGAVATLAGCSDAIVLGYMRGDRAESLRPSNHAYQTLQ